MSTQTLEGKDLIAALAEIEDTPLAQLVSAELGEVIRHIVTPEADSVPAVPIAAFTSAI
jgi:hypothetical protein